MVQKDAVPATIASACIRPPAMPKSDRATWSFASVFTSPILALSPMVSRPREDSMREFMQLHRNTVPYVVQSYSWDCGVACAEMALRARGAKQISCQDLIAMLNSKSVWSIDLAYLLHRFGLRITFFTITKGVHPAYRKQAFYRRRFPLDTNRVVELFDRAEQDGIDVVQRSVPLSEICHAVLEQSVLVLVLVDKRFLECSICDKNPDPTRPGYAPRDYPGFLGHYVLIYAYHPGTKKFLIKDPSRRRETCVISTDILEQGRRAFGTDQDIIFIGDLNDNEKRSCDTRTERT